MKTRFVEFSEIQVFVENKMQVLGEEQKDTLYVNIGTKEPKINIILENSTEEELNFEISSDNFQNIVNWLKIKQIIE